LDVKDIKCPLQWWQKHEAMFHVVRFLAHQILNVVGSQIEIERIFLWLEYLLTLGDVVCKLRI
jgi:hypothetical protein